MSVRSSATGSTSTLRVEVVVGILLLCLVVGLYVTKDRWMHGSRNSAVTQGGVEVGPVVATAPNPALNAADVTTISFRQSQGSPAVVTGEPESFHLDLSKMSLSINGTYENRPFSGTFLDSSGVVLVKGSEMLGGSITFATSSFRTEDLSVAAQLQGQAGLDAMTYPSLSFDMTSIVMDKETPVLSGVLIIKGVQKELSLPLRVQGKSYQGEMSLDAATVLLSDPALGKELTIKVGFGWK